MAMLERMEREIGCLTVADRLRDPQGCSRRLAVEVLWSFREWMSEAFPTTDRWPECRAAIKLLKEFAECEGIDLSLGVEVKA